MTSAKEKLFGIILIVVGAFPLLMNISSFSVYMKQYAWVSYVYSGQIAYAYQAIIIILGVFLLLDFRRKAPAYPPYPYPPRR